MTHQMKYFLASRVPFTCTCNIQIRLKVKHTQITKTEQPPPHTQLVFEKLSKSVKKQEVHGHCWWTYQASEAFCGKIRT